MLILFMIERGDNMKIKNLNFKVDSEIHRKLKVIAAKEGKSMSDIIVSLIEEYIEDYIRREGEDEFK